MNKRRCRPGGIAFGSNPNYTYIGGVVPFGLYEDSNGNIGLGTSSLLSRLNVDGGVGIGTALSSFAYLSGNPAPSGGLIVQNNVGIGTFNPFGGKLIVSGGNVGVGSLTPGQLVDVQGTIRALYFIGNGSQLTNISAGGWIQVGNNIYNTNTGNVGINTTNGSNVGIGTWLPADLLQVGKYKSSSSGFLVDSNGNVGIGTTITSGSSLSVMNAGV